MENILSINIFALFGADETARETVDAQIVEAILDLSRFDAAPLIAFIAKKETDYGTETDGRIPC